MKQLLLTFLLVLPLLAQAQIKLKPGYYKSQDGYVTITITQKDDVIDMVEPTRTNQYKRTGGNTYEHVEAKYAHYGLIVTDAEHFDATKNGTANHTWTYSGKAPSAEDFVNAEEHEEDCEIAQVYMQRAQEGGDDTQVNTFCGAAALMKCNMNEEGYTEYARQTITSLKQILVNPRVNPCRDVFSDALWNAN
jgi:hypothetical protein